MATIDIIINKHTINKYRQVFLLRFSPLQLLLLPLDPMHHQRKTFPWEFIKNHDQNKWPKSKDTTSYLSN